MAIENLKKHMILALLFLIYHFWLYMYIARKKNKKACVTLRHLGINSLRRSLSLSLSLSICIKHFPPFTPPFLSPQLQQQQQQQQ
jgi:hypothetical protein